MVVLQLEQIHRADVVGHVIHVSVLRGGRSSPAVRERVARSRLEVPDARKSRRLQRIRRRLQQYCNQCKNNLPV